MADPGFQPPFPQTEEEFIAQLVALTNRVAELEAQQLQAQPPPQPPQAPAAPATVVAAPAPRIKFNKPDDFTGDSATVDTFLRQCHTYFMTFPTINDATKVSFALSYMKGPIAGKWADRQHDAIQNGEADAILSWEGPNGFIPVFKSIFGDPDRQATARHKIALLRQGSKTVDQFIIDFEILEADADLGEGALIEHLKRGLQPRLVERIFGLEHLPLTLKDWKDYARRFDRHHRQFLEWQNQTRPSMSAQRPRPFFRNDFARHLQQQQQQRGFRTTSSTNPMPRASDVVPMEVDRTRRFGGSRGPRPLICWKCGQEGHRQNDCPTQTSRNIRTMQVEEPAVEASIHAEGRKEENAQGFVEDQTVEA